MTKSHRLGTCNTEIFFLRFSFYVDCGYFIFGCTGSSLLHMDFPWLQQAGVTLRCGAWASHCSAFSHCGAQAAGTWASVAVKQGLSCSEA